MNFEDERYVRVYTRDTINWMLLPWESRAVFLLLLRKVDRAGILHLDGSGARGVAALCGVPVAVAEAAVTQLEAVGYIKTNPSELLVPAFLRAQESSASDKKRQAEARARRRDTFDETCGKPVESVTKRDVPSQNVTVSHKNRQNVTPSLAVPCLAVPSLALPLKDKCMSADANLTPQKVADMWNSTAEKHNLPKVAKLNAARTRKLLARLKEHPELEFWEKALSQTPRLGFTGKDGREWKPNFDWFLQGNGALRAYESAPRHRPEDRQPTDAEVEEKSGKLRALLMDLEGAANAG